jgi:hypothetical protein
MLSNAFATRNLETWEFEVSDKVEKIVNQFDARCTKPLSNNEVPTAKDLTIDYRKWINLFTVDAIADIGLSDGLGMLGCGNDTLIFETQGGGTQSFNFVETLHGGNGATSIIVWSTEWFCIFKATHEPLLHIFQPAMAARSKL